jgi:hypothetical protein
MEFISTETGQSLQLFVMDEILPRRGGLFLPDLIAEIMSRYRFVTAPTSVEPGQPLKFQTGVWHDGDLTIQVVSLEIYNDGIIINSRNTEDSDVVMDDFLSWLSRNHGLREPITRIPRKYQSRIVVSISGGLDKFMPRFQSMSRIASEAFGTDDGLHLIRLSIGPNPPGQLPYQTTWQIEPRIGQPFVPDRFFSSAPLPTEAHIQLLAELEAAAMG